jgi:microcystin-dependent protein
MASPNPNPGFTVPSGVTVSPAGQQGLPGVQGSALLPAGTILDFAGPSTNIPTGFLNCDGTIYNISQYPVLGNLLGSLYGGDGTTTFGVPNCLGRTTIGTGTGNYTGTVTARVLGANGGEENHVLVTGELAAHNHTATSTQGTHTHTDSGHNHGIPGQTFTFASGTITGYELWGAGSSQEPTQIGNAAISTVSAGAITTTVANTGSGTGHNNMSPFIAFNKIIKT